jgi:protoheme IX farnesyltransferase
MSAPDTTPEATAPAPRSPWRPPIALAKPGITALICAVAVGGFVLVEPRSIDLVRLALLVGLGALASAGASMLNHYLDRDIDRRMRRTQGRPLAAAEGPSPTAVAVVGVAFLAVGVVVSAVVLNPLTGFSILLGGLTYVVVYTLWLKRRSSWNIVIGGFAGSAPALAGSAAALGTWTPGALAFALLVFLWTPPHFWSLALMIREDFTKAELPMLPRMDDPAYSGKVVVVSAALLVPAAILMGPTGTVTWPVLAVLVALGIAFVAFTLPLWHDVSRRSARRGFLFSGPYLLAVVVALLVNVLLVRGGVPTGF